MMSTSLKTRLSPAAMTDQLLASAKQLNCGEQVSIGSKNLYGS